MEKKTYFHVATKPGNVTTSAFFSSMAPGQRSGQTNGLLVVSLEC